MKMKRHGLGALVGAAAVFVGGGAALAGNGDARGSTCADRLAKIAQNRGIDATQLRAQVQARLLARIAAAEKAGKLSPERAARLRQRVNAGNVCRALANHRRVHVAGHRMVRAAAAFLGLDRKELRAQLPGTSLAALAAKQGKSTQALEDAMLAPAKARLAKAVANGRLSQAQATKVLERLQKRADTLANRVFPAR
jgi:hypothetical protein